MKMLSKQETVLARALNSKEGNCVVVDTGGLVRSGEFVACEISNRKSSIGQIICLEDRRDVEPDELIECGELDGHGSDRLALLRRCDRVGLEGRPLHLDPERHPRVPDSLTEVELTPQCIWIPSDQIKSIAFLFQVDTVQDGRHMCSGIENAFFLCGRRDVNNHEVIPVFRIRLRTFLVSAWSDCRELF